MIFFSSSLMSILSKKWSSSSVTPSRRSSNSSVSSSSSNYTTSTANTGKGFTKFDEKKDYVKRCSLKKVSGEKHPVSVSFCLRKWCVIFLVTQPFSLDLTSMIVYSILIDRISFRTNIVRSILSWIAMTYTLYTCYDPYSIMILIMVYNVYVLGHTHYVFQISSRYCFTPLKYFDNLEEILDLQLPTLHWGTR